MSAIASPPSAIITATSTRTLPRSWTGENDRRARALDNWAVRPVRSPTRRSPTLPAWATTPDPPPVTDKPADHEVRFTCRVPSSWGSWTVASTSFPCWAGTSVFLRCLLYTSDAADDLTRVDLGGRR